MLTIAPKTTAGPQRRRKAEKHVQILRLSAVGLAKGAAGADEIELKTGTEADLPQVNDIVVLDHKPWHYAGNRLRRHPQVHTAYPETILYVVRARNESAVWWSTEPFKITNIVAHSSREAGGAQSLVSHDQSPAKGAPTDWPHYPFTEALTTVIEDDERRTTKLYVVRSTVPVEEADDKTFKITFTMEGEPEPIDPDMHCGEAP